MTYSTNQYPYNDVVLIETADPNDPSDYFQGSGVVIGPHTILTASHVLFDISDQTPATTVSIYPAYNANGIPNPIGSGNPIVTQVRSHFNTIGTSGSDLIYQSDGAKDFGIIDTSATFGNFVGVSTNYPGGTVHFTSYPGNSNGYQVDNIGSASKDAYYATLDYASGDVSDGSSGGPLWTSVNGGPAVVGLVSTDAWGPQLTDADAATIRAWERGDTSLWENAPLQSGPTLRSASVLTGAMGSEWEAAGTANLTGVAGQGDLLWASGGTVDVWHMAQGQLVSSVTSNGSMGSGWSLDGAGDFNGDGRSDLFWTDGDGHGAVWTMNGSTAESITVTSGRMGSEWHAAGFGDVDGAGRDQAIWVDTNNDVNVWSLYGGTLTGATESDGHMGREWTLVGTGDVNGDGMDDLVWSRSDGEATVWFMNGAHVTSVATYAPGTSGSHVAAAKDFNADGFADLLWENSSSTGDLHLLQGASVKADDSLGGTLGPEWNFAGAQDVTSQGTPDLVFTSNGHALLEDLAPTRTL